ncbi:LOW QUALITY PROTEIN: Carboxypeptidase 2 [Paramyrothecium foliicola]|nr:LOW QUALITY PROTEIN: Carboxypeptidase 2 [Paramyrothecium foliicola]
MALASSRFSFEGLYVEFLAYSHRLTHPPATTMHFHGRLGAGLLCAAGLATAQVRYANNQVPTVKDTAVIAKNFPDVEGLELQSPAFTDPESVPEAFTNGTVGPTSQETMEEFLQALAARNSWMEYHTANFTSEEGRSMPYVFLSKPENKSCAHPKVRVWMQGGAHGNEPAGDQALLALLGKLDANATWADAVLSKVDILMLPRYNPDGVAYFQRGFASNFDPNRDHAKLARQQTRDIKRLAMNFAPHVGVDCHEYSGRGRYGIDSQWLSAADGEFSAMKNLNIHPKIRELSEDVFARRVASALESRGLRWSPYVVGNSRAEPVILEETTGEPRYGDSSIGLSQAVMFLTETRGIGLGDQHFQRRVASGLTMVEAIIQTAVDNARDVYRIIEDARADFIDSTEDIIITEVARPTNVSWQFIEATTGELVTVPVEFYNTTPAVANITRARPEAYVFPGAWHDVAERLRVMGVKVDTLEAPFQGEVEAYTIASSSLATTIWEGVVQNTVTVQTSRKEITMREGSFWVSTAQKNAAHAFLTLEPEAADSYARFNIIPVSRGDEFPVYRVVA